MREIVVSMQNMLLSEAVARSLSETGEFRVEQVLPGKTGDTFSLCRAAQADILLMEVSRLAAYTLENRLRLIDRVRRAVPGCQFVLLCDENSDPELAQSVKRARQDRLIDAFLYASVTPAYMNYLAVQEAVLQQQCDEETAALQINAELARQCAPLCNMLHNEQ